MKRLRSLRGVWGASMAAVAAAGAACWWLRGQSRAPLVAGATAGILTVTLMIAAMLDIAFCVWWFRTAWLPLCEGTLKRVWAGRLTSAEEGKGIVQALSARSVVIMAVLASPAVYAVVLEAMTSPVAPRVIWGLVGASVLGLAAFYWYGLQPVSDIFRHVERIAR